MSESNGTKLSPLALWGAVLGAIASGVSGIGAMGQLGQMQNTLEEQTRVAELRGKLVAEIQSNRKQIGQNRDRISLMITREGARELHNHQQVLIEKLISWTENIVTRAELITILEQRNRVQHQK